MKPRGEEETAPITVIPTLAPMRYERPAQSNTSAPMPGVISGLAVKTGQTVTAGDVLCSIEAMKMETAIHAEADGVIAEVLVKPGDQIDAKDLLVRFE